jgi:hypothetical protein
VSSRSAASFSMLPKRVPEVLLGDNGTITTPARMAEAPMTDSTKMTQRRITEMCVARIVLRTHFLSYRVVLEVLDLGTMCYVNIADVAGLRSNNINASPHQNTANVH